VSSPTSDVPNRPFATDPRSLPDTASDRAVKVAAATAAFWVIKVLTTGMGETASDFLARTAVPELAVGLTGLVLAALLVAQVRAARFHPWLYWAAVAMVSVFGTMAADVLHIVLGVSYLVSTVAFGIAVAVLLALWHRVEGTLAIHSITTRRREVFYWCTVLATFALGTAAGDLTATTLGLGYLASGVLFAAAIAVPAVAHRWWGLNAVLAFWIAYVLTRPLGASFADWLAVSPDRAGLDLGTGPVSAVLVVVIVIAVAVTSRRRRNGAADVP
jgi:uncharacterized membrane-anchored protein